MKRRQQSAVALVTTLIMLSLITFTAVVFLAVTMREKDNVIVSEDMMDAKTLAGVALAEAQTELVARMLATTNPYLYDLIVSETTVPYRLDTANPVPESNVTNFISQLIYDARPPVYVRTNLADSTQPWQHRFWLDFNRNGFFEPTGWLAETNEFGSATGTTNYYVGDPQWKGIFQFSMPTNFGGERRLHSSSNKFVGRIAWMIVPYGKSLDLNYLHNEAKKITPVTSFSSSFRRNQGVGSHELNLAAMLANINSNVWAAPNVWTTNISLLAAPFYEYYTNYTVANRGLAFIDAKALLSYRNPNFNNLASVDYSYGTVGDYAITNDFIDHYLYAQPMIGLRLPTLEYDVPTDSWPGGANTNPTSIAYFDFNELFVRGRPYSSGAVTPTPPMTNDFTTRLLLVGTNVSTYDRYTIPRMLSQLGTVSSIPPGEKVHLNYDNRQPNSPTAFIGWEATNFFNETAERLLRTNFNISLTDYAHTNHIEIYPTNRYTAAVHRMLQLTANIFDATTNRNISGYPYFPTVFRPIFTNYNNVVSIVRYEEVTNTAPVNYPYITREFASTNMAYVGQVITNNIWGVPWVIGVKKGYPNFNEFALRSAIQVSRRLEVLKANTNTPVTLRQTNQLFVLGISNLLGGEMWNPYTNAYPRNLDILARLDVFAHLTNQFGAIRSRSFAMATNASFAANAWTSNAFFLPFYTNYVFLPDAQFFNSSGQFVTISNVVGTNVVYERGQQFYVPRWGLSMSNRMFAAIMDRDSDRVVDFVNYDSFTFGVEDVMANLVNADAFPGQAGLVDAGLLHELFDTNRIGGTTSNHVTRGVLNQIYVSLGRNTLQGRAISQQDWNNYGLQSQSQMDKLLGTATFQRFMGQPVTGVAPYHSNPNGNPLYYVRMPSSTNMQTPFTAVAKIVFTNYWQANDPLVHYTMEDMGDQGGVNLLPFLIRPSSAPLVTNNLNFVNDRYRPWGVRQGRGRSSVLPYDEPMPIDYTYEYRVKDPQIRKADDWDFPGQKFANIGWLGRVHRGTPWQTVYMKAGAIPDQDPNYDWRRWAYNRFTHPTNDWVLPDFFTTATDVRSVSGLLSVNQTNYGAWAAVLGDVLVLSNTMDFNSSANLTNIGTATLTYTNLLLDPTGTQLREIVDGINLTRSTRLANLGGGLVTTNAFVRMGDILSVPQLSVGDTPNDKSPYLSLFDSNMLYGVHDVAIERIPQQILSLLKVDDMPRVVVYSWGQALKPAANSVVLSGQYRGMVTNYTVVSEHVTRTVLRIEGGPRNPRAVVENFTVIPAE
ncbi:MAG TPA: hypothetical protein VGH19_07920 [Verrucomicrobiae bacterium]